MPYTKPQRSFARKVSQKMRRVSHRVPIVRPLVRGLSRVLQLDDTPESIGRGVGLGLFVAFTPTVGVQMFIILIVNTIFRANRLAGVFMVWLTNPVTVVPVYWWNYICGCWILRETRIGFERFEQLFSLGREGFFGKFLEFTEKLGHLGLDVIVPLTLGGCITGVVLGLIAYPLTVTLVRKEHAAIDRLKQLRQRRKDRKHERLKDRARKELGLPEHGLDDLAAGAESTSEDHTAPQPELH